MSKKYRFRILVDGSSTILVEADTVEIYEGREWVKFYIGNNCIASFPKEKIIAVIKDGEV